MRGRLLLAALCVWLCVCATAHASAQVDSTDPSDSTAGAQLLERFNLSKRHPAVGVSAGMTSFARKDLSAPIENAMAFGIDLGYRRVTDLYGSGVTSVVSDMVYFTYHKGGDVIAVTPQIIPESIDVLRFGFASRSGYGYKFGSGAAGISLLHGSSGLAWSVLNVSGDHLAIVNGQPLADFGNSLRFGEAWSPGIELQLAEPISLQFQYTWSQTYVRHMFWYWAGSATIEGIADAVTLHFIQQIAKSSPSAAPVMYFLLRNGVAAAFKALRMNRMNWPFNTEAPLNMHTFSVGATVTF